MLSIHAVTFASVHAMHEHDGSKGIFKYIFTWNANSVQCHGQRETAPVRARDKSNRGGGGGGGGRPEERKNRGRERREEKCGDIAPHHVMKIESCHRITEQMNPFSWSFLVLLLLFLRIVNRFASDAVNSNYHKRFFMLKSVPFKCKQITRAKTSECTNFIREDEKISNNVNGNCKAHEDIYRSPLSLSFSLSQTTSLSLTRVRWFLFFASLIASVRPPSRVNGALSLVICLHRLFPTTRCQPLHRCRYNWSLLAFPSRGTRENVFILEKGERKKK